MSDEFRRLGAVRMRSAIELGDWLAAVRRYGAASAGIRITDDVALSALAGEHSKLWRLVSRFSVDAIRPVRAILFNKTVEHNWLLGWHQDRTIAVRERHDVAGYGPWTVKQGITHVEPPFEIIERMLTVRVHLDDVDAENAPLRIAPGSHRYGRIVAADYRSILQSCGEAQCEAEAGDMWLYATPILHASHVSARPSQRRVVQIDYSPDPLPEPLAWAGV